MFLNKISIIKEEYSRTTVITGSKFLYFIFFWKTKALSFIQQHSDFLNSIIHHVVAYLPKPSFVIKNDSGTFIVQPFDDSTTICSDYFEQHLREWLNIPEIKDIFVDIGANRGIYTIIAPTLFGYKEVHSFEPNPSVVTLLNKNVELNQLQSKVGVHNTALGGSNGTLSFAFDSMHLGGGRIVSSESKSTIEVPVKIFDDFDSVITPERISFIKIDTEGFEFNVLKGMKNTLSKMPIGSCLMIESTEHEELKTFLLKYKFKLIDTKQHDHLFKKNA